VQGQESLKWSVDFTNSLNRLGAAADGAWRKVGAVVGPGLARGIDQVSTSIERGGLLKGAATGVGGVLTKIPGGAVYGFPMLGEMLKWLGETGTTREERTVRGLIGPAAGSGEGGMRAQAALSAEELARENAYERSDANIRELREAIASTRNPADRATLQQELDKLTGGAGGGLTINIHAPVGTTATVSSAGNPFSATRINYSMPTSGDMP
jgi:hypothetical protein